MVSQKPVTLSPDQEGTFWGPSLDFEEINHCNALLGIDVSFYFGQGMVCYVQHFIHASVVCN